MEDSTKYELLPHGDSGLFIIRALRDFGYVKEYEFGGLVSGELYV